MRRARLQSVTGPQHRGLTIVELMVTLTITCILAAIAVPSMREYIARQRVMGTAQELATDLRLLRSARSQRSAAVQVDFGSTADLTCYVLYSLGDLGRCDCTRTNTPVCDQEPGSPIELKTVVLPSSRKVAVSSNPTSLTLLQANGMPVGGTTLVVSVRGVDMGGEVRIVTNAAVTPTLCSVSEHGGSLPECP